MALVKDRSIWRKIKVTYNSITKHCPVTQNSEDERVMASQHYLIMPTCPFIFYIQEVIMLLP